ncbi:MAG: hypothetical protein U0805_02605 [Pirellulales bacterium]
MPDDVEQAIRLTSNSFGFMHRVLVLGAGKIGRMIARFLMDARDYDVVVGDFSDVRCSASSC